VCLWYTLCTLFKTGLLLYMFVAVLAGPRSPGLAINMDAWWACVFADYFLVEIAAAALVLYVVRRPPRRRGGATSGSVQGDGGGGDVDVDGDDDVGGFTTKDPNATADETSIMAALPSGGGRGVGRGGHAHAGSPPATASGVPPSSPMSTGGPQSHVSTARGQGGNRRLRASDVGGGLLTGGAVAGAMPGSIGGGSLHHVVAGGGVAASYDPSHMAGLGYAVVVAGSSGGGDVDGLADDGYVGGYR